MKKLLFFITTLIAIHSFAQINEGGKPYSLTNRLSLENIEEYKTDPSIVQDLIIKANESTERGELEKSGVYTPSHLTPYNSGTWTTLENGDRIWQLKITSEKALATSLAFDDFYLPHGAKMFVYTEDYSQVIGAFTSANNHHSGDFATQMLYNETSIIEYYEPASHAYQGMFIIEDVMHLFKNGHNPFAPSDDFGDSESCEVNINCSEGNNWQDEKKGVARIYVRIGWSGGWCTGSLLNNTAQDCTPYFLTAWHCADGASTADFNQWVFDFNYEFSGCNSTGGEPSAQTITGCQVRAISNTTTFNTQSDMCLLEFNNAIPSTWNDIYYNGWNRANTAPTSGVSIHHPAGDVKKISTFGNNTNSVTIQFTGGGGYQTSNNGDTHWNVQWISTANGHGVTEGGSSGSPLFDQNGLVIGSLSGGGSYCTATSSRDQYGKMSFHWTGNGTGANRQVDGWLDPVGNGSAMSLQGRYHPCTTVNDDAGITAINSPEDEVCGLQFTPIVTIRNYGSNNLTSALIRYRIDNGAWQTYNWNGNLSSNATEEVTLPAINTTAGNHTFTAQTQNPNGQSDANSGNDQASKSYTATDITGTSLPIQEGFESNSLPNTWSISNGDNDMTWERETAYGYQSNSCYIMDYWDYDAAGAYDWLVTDYYDFSSVSSPSLYFDYAYAYYDGNQGVNYDSLVVAYSIDCGNNWNALFWQGGTQLATVGGQSPKYTFENANDWDSETIDLTSLIGNSAVQFAFVGINGYGNTLAIDNINIQGTQTTLTTYYADDDGDGFGDPNNSTQASSQPNGYVTNNNDCNDGNSAINPNASEICDGLDNNCNGNTDEGLTTYTFYQDFDNDGYGNPANSITSCDPTIPTGYVSNNTDCADNNEHMYPGNTEICDGLDNNCNGSIDEGLPLFSFYPDTDNDGYGDENASPVQLCGQYFGYADNNLDCDDSNSGINPGVTDLANNSIYR